MSRDAQRTHHPRRDGPFADGEAVVRHHRALCDVIDAAAYSIPNAKDEFPEPDTPVNTTSASRGISTSTFFSRAPRILTNPRADCLAPCSSL
jgi:hypothetical protein